MKRDLRIILQNQYFGQREYADNNIINADNLINLVVGIVSDHIETFSPEAIKGLDNYPTVTINDKGDKAHNICQEDYLTRFKIYFYWFHLAKAVARFVGYDFEQDFIRPFNDPKYHCFRVDTTNIYTDLMEGRVSFSRHLEVAPNLFLTGEEGRALYERIEADFRKCIIMRTHAHLT